MHGNVWEWCADYYHPEAYQTGAVSNPTGPDRPWSAELFPGQPVYVVRGGSYADGDAFTRSSERDFGKPGRRMPNLGFRIVRELLGSD